LIYKSQRRLGDFAEGLIHGAIVHYGNTHGCTRQDLSDDSERQCVKFTLVRT